MLAFRFPENFALGVSSAATQVDGDCKNSNWYDWYQKGHISDGSNPDITTEHRKHIKEDTELMASLGIKNYRFGLEWSRIEPEQGVFDEAEFDKIREELAILKENGIAPLVTLHHFSNPMWFENMGGFLNKDCVSIFLLYVDTVVEKLGDVIDEYITINEPNVYAVSGYIAGNDPFPPGENSKLKALKVIDNMGECHRRAYELIHKKRAAMGYTNTKVGFAHHMRAFAPYNAANPWHRVCCKLSRHLFQGKINKTFLLGTAHDRGVYADFLGVNYYSRTASKGLEDNTFPGVPVNDRGWEIYPAGLVECCSDLHKILPDLPIYITENGTADNNDAFRRHYLYDHLKAITESGLPITRYYHWCFVDNFEWIEGFSARFGIVDLNTETMARTVKKSGEFYKEMIENHGVTEEMADAALGEAYKIG